MMKKILSILLSISILAGCNKNSEKVMIEPNEGATTFISINSEDMEQMKNDKEDFVLFVYREGCAACETFKTFLNEFIYLYQISIYGIDMDKGNNNNYVIENVSGLRYTPTLVIYKDGKQIKKADPKSYATAFDSSIGVASFLFKYIDIK